MSTIILPDHNLIRHPKIVEDPKTPVMYADGGFSRADGAEMMRIAFYRRYHVEVANEILIIMMTRANFQHSMVIEAAEHLPDIVGGARTN